MEPDLNRAEHDTGSGADGDDAFGAIPDLPLARQRWTTKRKASVVEAIRGGWVPVEEACRLYSLSADEIVAWERDFDRHGVPGLRSTRVQIYRKTDGAQPARSMRPAARIRYLRENRSRARV
jgi:hypothetical protein